MFITYAQRLKITKLCFRALPLRPHDSGPEALQGRSYFKMPMDCPTWPANAADVCGPVALAAAYESFAAAPTPLYRVPLPRGGRRAACASPSPTPPPPCTLLRPPQARNTPTRHSVAASLFPTHGWHKASVSDCLPLAAPIGLSPLLILTLCGPEHVLVVSTEPLDDLSCLTTPGLAVPETGCCHCR